VNAFHKATCLWLVAISLALIPYFCFMNPLQQRIQQLAKQYHEEFINVRHHLHAHPELSYLEFETSKYIQQQLQQIGIPFEIKATTGVIGILKGKNPEKKRSH